MCLACQMEDELWFAYLDQVARQEKASAKASAADAAKPAETRPESKPAPSSPFACDEPPSE